MFSKAWSASLFLHTLLAGTIGVVVLTWTPHVKSSIRVELKSPTEGEMQSAIATPIRMKERAETAQNKLGPTPIAPDTTSLERPSSTDSGSTSETEPARTSGEVGLPTERETTQPSLIEWREPAYPARARRLRLEGAVTLSARVAADGTSSQVIVLVSSGSKDLDTAALKALTASRFVPGTRGSEAVEADFVLKVSFRLTD